MFYIITINKRCLCARRGRAARQAKSVRSQYYISPLSNRKRKNANLCTFGVSSSRTKRNNANRGLFQLLCCKNISVLPPGKFNFQQVGLRPTNFPQALVWTFLALNFLLLSQIQLNLIFNNIIN